MGLFGNNGIDRVIWTFHINLMLFDMKINYDAFVRKFISD